MTAMRELTRASARQAVVPRYCREYWVNEIQYMHVVPWTASPRSGSGHVQRAGSTVLYYYSLGGRAAGRIVFSFDLVFLVDFITSSSAEKCIVLGLTGLQGCLAVAIVITSD